MESRTPTTAELRAEFERMKSRLDASLGARCGNCSGSRNVEIHHVVPLALGGTNNIGNLVRLCAPCHDKAHGRTRKGNFKEAQAAGIDRARAAGIYKGRPKNQELHDKIFAMLKDGGGIRPTARQIGCSTTTVIKARQAMIAAGELPESFRNSLK